ncbi:hypothetical protein ORV05_04740 [Amycolatopsis cynarae]|uniref:DNA (cytosine-5-)-methyltransferase n=1 Tax=Amycolatopsis cynarae TaxID=2995223 RepID=A0ABY7B619_9PSEU|nr:hypothetical protein [Amycolatopsis sp. HUAS 11-8]WAL67098.1 hypothetical protein ORV05_04740 [Amycolatopsis sp. HUAS 11-8]
MRLLPTPTVSNAEGGNKVNNRGLRLLPAIARDAADATDWGVYAAAVRRWEVLFGRPAPEPTVTGARGARVLSPYLVEWMMGLPEGLVTATPGLTRNQMLKLLGNGVVPQQAEHALRGLLPRLYLDLETAA